MIKQKNTVIFILDLLFTIGASLIAFFIIGESTDIYITILITLITYSILRIPFNVGKTILRRMSLSEMQNILLSNTISFLIISAISVIRNYPINVSFLILVMTSLFQIVSRIIYIKVYSTVFEKNADENRRNIAIFGAGKAGELVAQELFANVTLGYRMVGYFDDNVGVKRNTLLGYKIFGGRDEVAKVVKDLNVEIIYIAMPSISKAIQNDIAEVCYKTGVDVRIVPSFKDLLNKANIVKDAKSIEIVDLLNRNEISLSSHRVSQIITDKVVFISGAGGSIGSELVRQIVQQMPKELVIMDISENGIYSIQQEIEIAMRTHEIKTVPVFSYICSMTDKDAVERIFKTHKINVVFHAAAHKHVPLMESSPLQALKNNVFGTLNMIRLSTEYGVQTFLNISTDKAVNPTNVMGATKRIIEMLLLRETKVSKTKFVAVRFGNVLGSNGSVIPLFKNQIDKGGPVTVTHPEIVRYFMTIPEAVSLVLEAATFADGGEIFVLDMGEPVKILSMAEKMIELSGLKPYEDIQIEFTGLRPGEKLYEELNLSDEGLRKTDNELIYIISQTDVDADVLDQNLEELSELIKANADKVTVIETLERIVPTFKHEEN